MDQDRPNPAEAGGEGPAGSPDAAPPPRSEAQAAELAALEAMLPPVRSVPETGCGDAEGARPPGDRHGAKRRKGRPESDAG